MQNIVLRGGTIAEFTRVNSLQEEKEKEVLSPQSSHASWLGLNKVLSTDGPYAPFPACVEGGGGFCFKIAEYREVHISDAGLFIYLPTFLFVTIKSDMLHLTPDHR